MLVNVEDTTTGGQRYPSTRIEREECMYLSFPCAYVVDKFAVPLVVFGSVPEVLLSFARPHRILRPSTVESLPSFG